MGEGLGNFKWWLSVIYEIKKICNLLPVQTNLIICENLLQFSLDTRLFRQMKIAILDNWKRSW